MILCKVPQDGVYYKTSIILETIKRWEDIILILQNIQLILILLIDQIPAMMHQSAGYFKIQVSLL